MITQILVPTDFSEVANNALRYAIALANRTKSTIHLLHVKSYPIIDPAFPVDTFATLIEEMDTISREGLNRARQSLLDPSGVKYILDDISGFVNDEIERYAKEHGIDLIAMGTTGASGLQELLVGSNAATTIGRSEIPVLVIPPSAGFKEIKHILYASDYTEPEFPALSRLIYFAELYDADISVVHVKTDYDRFFDSANNFFVKNKAHIKRENIKLIQSEKADVSEAINHHIDHNQTDLLVLAKHNRSFFDRLFHRSISKQMAYHTKIPLLVLHK
jgi:nucleotide-binding universal stress UspA family protein